MPFKVNVRNKLVVQIPHIHSPLTVWKFQDFCISQILREINFVDSRSAKTAIIVNLGAVNFVHLVTFSLQKVQKFMKIKIQNL